MKKSTNITFHSRPVTTAFKKSPGIEPPGPSVRDIDGHRVSFVRAAGRQQGRRCRLIV